MNRITERIFKNRKPNSEKLIKFGFVRCGDEYSREVAVMERFTLKIKISNTDINTRVTDCDTGDEYTLFLVEGAVGGFVGAMRSAYENVLTDIANDCFDKCVFKSDSMQELICYAQNAYGSAPEFLWESFDNNAILRRQDSKKWYALLVTLKKSKLGLRQEGDADIAVLRADPDVIPSIVDNEKIFAGYHMNKKHWITVCLDGSLPFRYIRNMIDASYELARK